MKLAELNYPSAGVCTLTLTTDAAAFEAALEHAYQDKKATYALEGYEVGEAPRAAIEEKEGEGYFYYDAVNILLGKETDTLLEETFAKEGITALTPPEPDVTRCDKEGVSVCLTVGILPEVTLGQYKGLQIDYPRIVVPQQAIDGQLEMLRHRVAAQKGTPEQIPALDDAFAGLFECENVAALRKKMEDAMQEMITKKSYQQATFMLLEEIGKNCTVTLPDLLLHAEFENAMRNLHDYLAQNQISMEQYLTQMNKTAQDLEAEHREGAARALRGKLAMHAIAKQENITASDKEVESEMVRLSAQYRKTVSDFMAETPAYMVRNEIVLYRTLETIAKENTLNELPSEANA